MCLISGHSLVDCPKADALNGVVYWPMVKRQGARIGDGTFSLSNSFEALNVENPVIEEVETGIRLLCLVITGSDDEVEYVNNEMASYLDSNRQGWIWY
ncbi:hypothetical protein Tco_0750299 [Tanacetum coccineum]|uniref:Uncharacterized protein n=1 Tax=Tanacetum coccineum TaxID=301880 RepID=A0ABQ4Z0V6_9ASTR